MKSECCHQHPDNGSDLAVQTDAQAEETDLRAVNAKLTDALECYRLPSGHFVGCLRNTRLSPTKEAHGECERVCELAREAIEEARK